MNLLVTGGLGHIGSKMIRDYALRKELDFIRILDNLSSQRYCSLFNLPETKKYQFVEGDVISMDLSSVMEGIDTIMHLAAITDAPSTLDRREETFKVNLDGTKRVLEAALKNKVKKFLLPSTTSVYGETSGLVDETFKDYKPCSPYAESKLEAEEVVKNIKGIEACVLRMGTVFGSSPGMRFHTAVNKFVLQACLGKPLTVWENALDQKRPYLGINDCVRAFEFVEKKGKAGEVYNVLTENYTVREVVEAIKKVIPELKVQLTKAPILNQKSYHVSNDKIRNLGFEFKDSLEDEVRRTADLLRQIRN